MAYMGGGAHGMTVPKPKSESVTDARRKPGATWRGWLPDDDPIYRDGGWNFLAGKNLKPEDKGGE